MIRAHILCLLLASAALAQGQDKPPPIHPDVAAFAEAHRRVQTLRATVKTRYFGDRDVSVTLTFARPGRSRLEVKGENASLRVRRGDRSLSVNPRENQYYRRDGEANPSGWTGFSDPATSILTLLEPGPQDRDLLEHGWLPRLRSLGTETVDGQPLVHLRGWAQSARLDLWYSPTDGLLRRFALSDADGAPFANGTIAIEALNQPVPAATFDLRPPRGMLAPEMEAWREVRSFPPLGPALARLTGRPRADDLRQMAGIYHDSGQSALAVLLLCQAARLEPTPARYQEALQAALEQGALLSVTRLYNDAMRRFGERFIRGQDTLLLQLMGAPQVPPELHTLLKSQLRTAGAWEARLSLARLALQRGAAREALDLFLGAVPEGEPEAELRRRVDALGEQSDFLAPLARAITPVDRPRLAAALRRLDAYVAPEALSPWIDCYASLDQPDTALQLFERTEPDQLDYSVLSRLGDRLLAAGRRPDAERVLRQALAAVVTDEWISYQMVGQLLVSPGARTLLAPVLRQLAEADRPRDPYQAGHWLFLAGDWPAAMQAYRDFLERTAGGLEAASAALRCASACLGVEAAAQAGDEAQRQWFIGVAADELPFVCAEQPGSSWPAFSFLSRWLPQLRDPALRARLEERLIDAIPDPRVRPLPVQPPVVAPGASPSPEEQARVKQVLSSLLRRGLLEEVIVSPCVAAGLTEEMVAAAIRLANERPTPVRGDVLTAVAAAVKDSGPVLAAVEKAVRDQPDWTSGARALVAWYQQHRQPQKALALLRRVTGDSPMLEDHLALARLEIRVGQKAAAAARLLRLMGRPRASGQRSVGAPAGLGNLLPPGIQQLLGRPGTMDQFAPGLTDLLRAAGRPQDALAVWRRMARSNQPYLVLQAVEGLRRGGARAEAKRILETRYREMLQKGSEGSTPEPLRQALLREAGNRPEAVLRLYPEVIYLDAAPAPDLLAQGEPSLPAHTWREVARLLERRGRAPVALAMEAAALLQEGGQPGTQLRAFIDRCRHLGRLPFARDLLRYLEGTDERGEHLLVHAELARSAGERDEAMRLLRQYALAPGEAQPHRRPHIDQAASQLADLLREAGQVAEAGVWARRAEAFRLVNTRAADPVATAEHAVALVPESPCLRITLARRLWTAGRKEEACAALDQGYLRLPAAADGASLCVVCQAALSPALAEGESLGFSLDRLRALDEQSGVPYYLAAVIADAVENPEARQKRRQRLEEAVRRSPDLVPAWEQLCSLYQQDGSSAEQLLRAAREWTRLQPEDARAWSTLGAACMEMQLSEEGRAAFQRAESLEDYLATDGFNVSPQMAPWVERFLAVWSSFEQRSLYPFWGPIP